MNYVSPTQLALPMGSYFDLTFGPICEALSRSGILKLRISENFPPPGPPLLGVGTAPQQRPPRSHDGAENAWTPERTQALRCRQAQRHQLPAQLGNYPARDRYAWLTAEQRRVLSETQATRHRQWKTSLSLLWTQFQLVHRQTLVSRRGKESTVEPFLEIESAGDFLTQGIRRQSFRPRWQHGLENLGWSQTKAGIDVLFMQLLRMGAVVLCCAGACLIGLYIWWCW